MLVPRIATLIGWGARSCGRPGSRPGVPAERHADRVQTADKLGTASGSVVTCRTSTVSVIAVGRNPFHAA